MQDVNPILFFEMIADAGVSDHLDKIGDIVVHVLSGRRGVIIVPVYYDVMPGESVAMYLAQLGMFHLLPYLVPDHPAVDIARRLPPPI